MLINSFSFFFSFSFLRNRFQDHRQKWNIYATGADGYGVQQSRWFQGFTFDQTLSLCVPQMYGMGGESLRNLTEKLRAVSHSLQMGIQSRWRINGYDGSSTTKLSAGVLQLVVELITSAKGLFSVLNR